MKAAFIAAIGAIAVAMASGNEVYSTVDAGPPPPPPAGDAIPVPADPFRSRHRRQACGTSTQLTSDQVAESLNLHNTYRGKEPSSNGFQMNWDVNLAAQAQAYAQQCTWQHGMLTDCAGNSVGQNLFMVWTTGAGYPNLNMTSAITSWYNERQYWNSTSGGCQPNQVCGHWTQVVWSTTTAVGCGYYQCPTVYVPGGSNVTRGLFVVCDYSPPGNWVGQQPYSLGVGCSNCSAFTRGTSTPGYTCANNLCSPCSPSSSAACQCGPADTCSGNGVWQQGSCACECNAGYFGSSCQNACVNAASNSACVYWQSLNYCSPSSIYYAYMKANCVNTCQLCF